MCIAFFTLEHPEYALILCSNRDEDLARPTLPASFHGEILSGVDVQAGGTWLAISRAGKVGVATNITEPPAAFASSRGHLIPAFLAAPPSHPLDADIPHDAPYAGFNLVLLAPATPTPLTYDALLVTNHGAGGPVVQRALADHRLRALSNGIDGAGADDWPKVQHGLHAFERLLDALPPHTPDDTLAARLFDLLTWRPAEPPRDRSELKNTIQVDPLVIGDKLYGTRLSTVVLVSRTGRVLFIERDRWQLAPHPTLADPASQRVFRFWLNTYEGSM